MGSPSLPAPYSPYGMTPQAPQPGASAPIGGQMTPQSQYMAQLMKSMGSQPQGNATGLGSNLMADALMQYAMQNRGAPGQGAQNYTPLPGSSGTIGVGVPNNYVPTGG